MRRALAILKYVPAVLCGLLVVAWVVSIFCYFGYATSVAIFGVFDGTICWSKGSNALVGPFATFQNYVEHYTYFGELNRRPNPLTREPYTRVPIPLVLGAMLPLSVAPFARFRFPLWSYFAWTSLLAAELAFYLRAE